jgi:hypothetical protein
MGVTVVFPKEGQATHNASFPRYPSRSKNEIFLLSAAQNTSNLFDLEACPAHLIWPSFGNTTVYRCCAEIVIVYVLVRFLRDSTAHMLSGNMVISSCGPLDLA